MSTIAAPGAGTEVPSAERGALATAGARALLIGAGRYTRPSDLPDLPSVPVTVTALRDVLVEGCGMAPGNIGEPLLDPVTPAEIGRALVDRAGDATDVLLVYYCGHGLIGGDAELYLAASQTVSDDASLGFTALSYRQLRQSLAGCQARTIVVILDCCFAGRVADPVPGTLASLAAPGAPAGSYLLAAAAYGEAALAPPGEPHTAFGGALIRLLSDGIPDGPRLLTLTGVYQALDRTLSAQGRPRPRNRSSGSAGDLILRANPRYRPPRVPSIVLPPESAGDAGAPYRGLAAYQEADAPFFFGRERLVQRLRGALASQLSADGPLVLLGPSGAGKSSLLRAGLRPSLDDGLPGAPEVRSWPKVVFTPGSDPLGSLAAQLGVVLMADPESLRSRLDHRDGLAELAAEATRLRGGDASSGSRRLIVIVDQFEEIFAPGVPRDSREAFLAAMQAATTRPGTGEPPPVLAIVGLRADFYGRALSEPFLADAITRKRTLDITPMSSDELRDVITKPAAAAGLTVEPELVNRILADLRAEDPRSSTGYDTRLPLLSHALLATWRYREGSTLTLRGYQAAGGVSGAVARSAQRLWSADGGDGQVPDDGGPPPLTEEERDVARRLLLELVYVGPEETEITRRRVPLPELAEALGATPAEPDQMRAVSRVLGKLVAARLVTVDRDHAEIIHDALLRTWPQLRQWIDADRVNLAIGRQVSEAAGEWDRLGRHRGDLYSGSRLDIARDWESITRQIPPLAAEFLRRSNQAARARRQTVIAVIIAMAAALALIATLLVISVNDGASLRARNNSLESEQVAASANTIRSSDPELARDLALSAYHLAPTGQAAQSLAEASVTPAATEINVGGEAEDVAYSSDSALLAVSSVKAGGTISLWTNPESGHPSQAGTLPIHTVCGLAFVPAKPMLATSCDGANILWNVARPGHPVPITVFGRPGQPAYSAAISPDGRWLATGGTSGLLQLWDISDQSHPRLAGSVTPAGLVTSVAFSADSRALAVDILPQGRVVIANMRSSVPLSRLTTVPGADGSYAVSFSPRGHILAAAGWGAVLFYDATDPESVKRMSGHFTYKKGTGISIAFTPDSRAIAVGLDAGGIVIGSAAGQGAGSYTLPSSAATFSVAFSPDGRYVAGTGEDGIVRMWNAVTRPLASLTTSNFQDQRLVSPDGRLLATSVGNGSVEVWDISDPARPVRDSVMGPSWRYASFTADHRILMTSSSDGTELQLWNLADPRSPTPLGQPFHTTGPLTAEASPYSTLFAIADSGEDSITVWDIRNPADPVRRATITSTQLAGFSNSSTNAVLLPVFLGPAILGAEDAQNSALLRWEMGRPGAVSPLPSLPTPGGFADLDFQSGRTCHTLVTASYEDGVKLWDAAKPSTVISTRTIDTATKIFGGAENSPQPLSMTDTCQLLEATNTGSVNDVKVWDVRDPRSPHLIATLPTTGTVQDIEVSDDGTRVAALIQPVASSQGNQALDVWSLSRSGAIHQIAALQVSGDMDYAEFIPNSHRILFEPTTSNEVLPGILDSDPDVTYRSLCATTQNALSPSAWSRYVPAGIPYEPRC